jgi:hypothetical protein
MGVYPPVGAAVIAIFMAEVAELCHSQVSNRATPKVSSS